MELPLKSRVIVLCLLLYLPGFSQKSEESNPQQKTDTTINSIASQAFEIENLIIDETISKAGHEFQELFFQQWSWPQVSNGSFIIVIAERPFRGTSTQISIAVNELTVFESFLQPRYEYLEYLSEAAVQQTAGYLNQYDMIMQELNAGDMQGTGIY